MNFSASIHTLIYMNTLAIFSMALCLMLVTRGSGLRGPLIWGWGLLAAFAGFGLIGLRNQIPDFVSIVLANGLLSSAYTLFGLAMATLNGPDRFKLWRWLPPTLVVIVGGLLTGQRPAQITLVNLAYCLQISQLVYQLYNMKTLNYSRGKQLLLGVFGFMALVFFMRLASLILGKVPSLDSASTSTVQVLTHTAAFCLGIIGSFSFLYTCLEIKQREAEMLASTDSLTGLANRRAFIDWSENTLAILQREYGLLSLLMVDVDHFKSINDRFGHALGDAALQRVAHTLHQQVRQQDFVARMGGEEFIIGLPNTDLPGALHLAEKLRQAIEQTPFSAEQHPVQLTASIGVYTARLSEAETAVLKIDQLVHRADLLLYEAKTAGRNCVRGAASSDSLQVRA